MPTLQQLFRRKPVTEMSEETGADTGRSELARTIGTFQLIDVRRRRHHRHRHLLRARARPCPSAGPAVIVSFVLAGIAAGLTALCYAEMASRSRSPGRPYSYAYATLGEVVAMGVAACLLLEYGVSTAAVAVGWSGYLNELLDNLFGFQIPARAVAAPFERRDRGIINLPAVVLVVLVRAAADPRARASPPRSTRSWW